MCIRDSVEAVRSAKGGLGTPDSFINDPGLWQAGNRLSVPCLLYTSDAADERSSVDLGGRRIIKKKKKEQIARRTTR